MADDYIYKNQYIWGKDKNEINKRKHHISFETASDIFLDPFLFEVFDELNSKINEDRFNVIGYIDGHAFVTVSVTYREFIRIFSARESEPKEVRSYNEHAKNLLG
jgi:uncharacterized DUF497 family protein